MWTAQETGVMNAEWMKVSFRTVADKLERLLPPGFALRGEPVVSVSCAWFNNLYWLAGRSYGILSIDFPVTYRGKTETLEGAFCPVIWEGAPDAIMTGREELGFPKMFADFTPIDWDKAAATAACSASWLGHTFCDIRLTDLVEVDNPPKTLPGSGGGPQLYFKYMPRTGPMGGAGADVAYATTGAPASAAAGGQNIRFDGFDFRKWTAKGVVDWRRATFQQVPLAFHVINTLADLDVLEFSDAEMVAFSGPGIGICSDGLRVVEPA